MNDIVTVFCEVGTELPKINGKLFVNSPITGNKYEVKIKKILHLKWIKNKDLQVTVEGVKKLINNG